MNVYATAQYDVQVMMEVFNQSLDYGPRQGHGKLQCLDMEDPQFQLSSFERSQFVVLGSELK